MDRARAGTERADTSASGPAPMLGWRVLEPTSIHAHPMTFGRIPRPTILPDELLVKVVACGVCRTDLHVSEGDLPIHKSGVVPGHEVVGLVEEVGDSVSGFAFGDRVGVPWLHSTCGSCRFCVRGAENLCPNSTYTGWDVDGGYAEYISVAAAFALALPSGYSDVELAPLLCAGIIGFRALERSDLPEGGRLGIYGFGGSGHLAAQIAMARGCEVHVMTRSPSARTLALELGVASVQGSHDRPPVPLDASILFAPVGDLVPVALESLDRGGVLSIAGIHLSNIPPMNYQRHLFYERQVRSVTANTRIDAVEFLDFAGHHHLDVRVQRYPLADADRALMDLADDRVTGAAVLVY
ncbi:zinc-binding alcohol dehydrogenase family protein [Rhodococcus sp. AQ5-07]|uniref:zinc-binding alcohol dehydrogenase family protein n=2 Tax=Rhodococcus sp. AQ5-07 TaxID=2054902 RepID=UPI0023DD42D7|nr:zinc-binding alcohol dehydrogenase family protein [Rhodococcus sp. AQ5-07]